MAVPASFGHDVVGRFAPSPTGPLHLGNLRTAVAAWLMARRDGGRFLMRVEDLDPAARPEIEAAQLDDLRSLGLDWDGPTWRQSERGDVYRRALDSLREADLVYPCFCTRREIREAHLAPHGAVTYSGACRNLSAAEVVSRSRTRVPALRFRSRRAHHRFDDVVAGPVSGRSDDVVVWRRDGGAAYNLAVVVDDGESGVNQVVRGDDLLDITPTQIELGASLGYRAPTYAHVPLVYGPTGERLAKRDGAVTLADLRRTGKFAETVLAEIGHSLGLCELDEPTTPVDLLARGLPRWAPWWPLGRTG